MGRRKVILITFLLGTATTTASANFSGTGAGNYDDRATLRYNSPFAGTDFAQDAINWAPVAAGLRWRYIGSADLRRGQTFVYESENHADMVGGAWNITDVQTEESCVTLPITDAWQSVVWSGPRKQVETEFNTSAAQGTSYPCSICLSFVGLDSATMGNCIAFEAVNIFEAYGDQCRGMTKSDQDLGGASRAISALLNAHPKSPVLNSNDMT